MLRRLISFFCGIAATLIFYLFYPCSVYSIYDPVSVPNNHFGIHIINGEDLRNVANLVNSSGGDWGYVKFVISENDRNIQKWQSIFDSARRMHLIPIVRLATKEKNGIWEKPDEKEIEKWVDFLDSLNWVIQNRYVIVFNEPNNSKEWGGEINPSEYSTILKKISILLKDKNKDFFILNAGFDASAPTIENQYMDEEKFIREMLKSQPDIFEWIDGWVSHSYPNPDFSSSPRKTGRASIQTYLWEKELLEKLGINKRLPIFIAETGWSNLNLDENKIAKYFKIAFEDVWTQPNIVAITPFVLNYQDLPFQNFSWEKKNGQPSQDSFYEQYYTVQSIKKKKGEPIQLTSAQTQDSLPQKLIQDSSYRFSLKIKNTGQSIWSLTKGYEIKVESPIKINLEKLDFEIEPFAEFNQNLVIETPKTGGEYNIDINLTKDNKEIAKILEQKIQIVSPLKLNFTVRSWFGKSVDGKDFTLSAFDKQNRVMYFSNISVTNGIGNIPEIHNLIPEHNYKFVVEKPYYLSKTISTKLSVGENTLKFDRIIPLDFNNNGNFDIGDVWEMIKHPSKSIHFILP